MKSLRLLTFAPSQIRRAIVTLLLAFTGLCQAGTWTVTPWTNDADTGINPASTIFAWRFGVGTDITINSFTVKGVQGPDFSDSQLSIDTDDFITTYNSNAPSRTAKPSKSHAIPRKGDSGVKWHSLWETMPSNPGLNSSSLSHTAAAEDFLAAHFQLTPRQAEVLNWGAEGKTNSEIGIILECSFNTVKTHLKEIFQRLGVHSRTAAACAYRTHIAGPLSPSEAKASAKKASHSRSKSLP